MSADHVQEAREWLAIAEREGYSSAGEAALIGIGHALLAIVSTAIAAQEDL